jgi:dihydroorotate dehydrogenase (fumarate)
MIDMSVSYMGLVLKNPIIASSCSLSDNTEGVKRLSDAGVAAIVLKSLFEEQIPTGLPYQEKPGVNKWQETGFNYVSEIPMTLRLDEYLRMIEKSKEEVPVPIIASINCISSDKWIEYTKYIEAVGADGIELNIAVAPEQFDEESSVIENHICEIVSKVTHNVNIPVSVKLGPYFTSIPQIARKVKDSGASGLVLFNRFYHPDFDINSLEFKSKNRFSSHDEMYNTLRWITILYCKVDCTLVANTGIHDGEDLVKQLLAGASAVQVASTLYINGLGQVKSMLMYLQKWMRSHEYRNIDEFRGIILQKNAAQPDYFQRQQYIRALVGID